MTWRLKWWQKELPPLCPAMDIPVMDRTGVIVGRIIINPNGKFVGTIEVERFLEVFSRAVTVGGASGVMILPTIEPTEPWKYERVT